MLEWFHFCTILNLQLFFCLTVYFLYMIEETLGFNGHNPVKSQILKVNLVDYLSTGSPDVIHQGVSPHFYWVFHHKEAHLFGWLISWSNLRLWSYWKVKRTRCQTGNSWITWCEVVTTGFAHVYIYIHSLCNFPALKSNMDLENRRLEKEIQFWHCDVWVPSYFFGVCLYVYLLRGSSSDAVWLVIYCTAFCVTSLCSHEQISTWVSWVFL